MVVAELCLNEFNRFCGCEDEWESYPILLKLVLRPMIPVLYAFWSIR